MNRINVDITLSLTPFWNHLICHFSPFQVRDINFLNDLRTFFSVHLTPWLKIIRVYFVSKLRSFYSKNFVWLLQIPNWIHETHFVVSNSKLSQNSLYKNIPVLISDCRADEFRCHDGKCISNELKCNGEIDCAGDYGEDELDCGKCIIWETKNIQINQIFHTSSK